MSKLGLVLSAGGSRGAYEAGVIYYIRTALPEKISTRNFEIQTGTSVGAINTAAMVSMAHDPKVQGEKLKAFWLSLKQENIYRRDLSAATHFLGATVGGMMRNFLTINPFQIGRGRGPHFESFLDTTPLKKLLAKLIPWKQIKKNIQKGPVDVLALNTTNLRNGHSEIFLQRKNKIKYNGPYICHEVTLGVEHVMASAAIPMIFPSVRLGKTYYADGGLRLFTPMSPAIQLGAEKLLVIGLRHDLSNADLPINNAKEKDPVHKTPSIANQLGRILNGLFIDRIQFDMEQLQRINAIIEAGEDVYGDDFLKKINQSMKRRNLELDIAKRGVRNIHSLEILPSESMTGIFLRWLEKAQKGEWKFSAMEKFFIRLLEIDPLTGSDLMSYLTFAPQYVEQLFELGYRDAESRRDDLMELLEA